MRDRHNYLTIIRLLGPFMTLSLLSIGLIFCLILNAAGQRFSQEVIEDVSFADDLSRVRHQRLPFCPIHAENITTSSKTLVSSATSNFELPTASISMQVIESSRCTTKNSQEKNELNSTFLSFDEWRVAKLSEETPERRVRSQEGIEATEGDTIGEDQEVDIGFFSNVGDSSTAEHDESEGDSHKHMFNFASLDCAATIVKTNPEAAGASSILNENKDKYLLNPCSVANKFVITELCQDILVEEIAIANYEFFSSTFNKVRFSVSDRYPVAKNGWTVLGEFDAQDSRNLQAFTIQNPRIWARYLRIEIISHHGNEYYCPISILRVHGKTMMDDFKMDHSKTPIEKVDVRGTSKEEIARDTTDEDIEDADHCDLWPSIDEGNISAPLRNPDVFQRCKCRLKPLKFEEFLRELNGTSCPAPPNQNVPTSSISTASTEESIFKNIIKRLTTLETNTSLSVLYMEEQSKLLSNSFDNLEKAQANKFDNLVSMFNDTMMDNLNVLRIFANQLKDQSIKIIEEQKLHNDQFTTQYVLRTENLEKELKLQRYVFYAVILASSITLLYQLLSEKSKGGERIKRDKDYSIIKFMADSDSSASVSLPVSPISPISISGSSLASD